MFELLQKNLAILNLFGPKFGHFCIFGCFLENHLSEFHVTWSETKVNCFESYGSFVSRVILDLAV